MVGALLVLPLLLLAVGCAKYNTYHNAKRSFDTAERVRQDALDKNLDAPRPAGTQKNEYEQAIKKAQKILDEYPGHSLTDDALFLQAKAHHRLESYRQSIRKFNLLFQNFPATEYTEEALYLQALNYLLIGALDSSQLYLDRLAKNYPKSKYQAETRKVSGDNSFAMQDWTAAADSYRKYLAREGESSDRDRVGLKLAESCWELGLYAEAAEVLQKVGQETESAELSFRAGLLRARVHVKMQDYEIVEVLLDQIRDKAPIYKAEGEVLLVEAEALTAQGRADEVAPLLQSMPVEWETPNVKARAAEIMGEIFMGRGEWDQAREKFQTALLKKDALEDEDRARRLNENLKEYMAAAQALPDAKGERVARLQLLQANSLLFGFERPQMAASLYVMAAVDTAADTTVAAKALYGAYLTYERYLDRPDSAAQMLRELEDRFPDSPQAFEARSGSGADLFDFLLAARTKEQVRNLEALSLEERLALLELGETQTGSTGGKGSALDGVRRRMVYLGRRDNIVFPPPAEAVRMITERQAQRLADQAEAAARQAQADSQRATAEDGSAGEVPRAASLVDESGQTTPAGGDTPVPLDQAAADPDSAATEPQPDPEAKDKEAKPKKQDDDWDFLR